jgi:3-oxoacyl-[acyl-carrier-protein] synthase II
MDQVAVTGLGIVSPLGKDPEEFATALQRGDVRVVGAPWADPERGRYAWISTVDGFTATDWMDERVVDGTDLFTQYAIAAAAQAVEEHGEELDPVGTGIVLGTTMSGVGSLVEAQRALDLDGPDAVSRKLNIKAWPNMAAGQLAMRWKLHGPLLTICTACASANDAIGTAAEMITTGRADVMIAGGTERGLCEVLYRSQAAYGMSENTSDPSLATLPFDVRRTGIVEGEGAAVVVLERADRALARGARIHGYVRGYASLSDGYHPSAPDPSARWEAEAIRRAQVGAGVAPGDVDAVIAHATSTPKGDAVEIRAINDVFGDRGDSLLVTSLKGSVGHTGAASAAMGVVAGLHAMQVGALPPVGGTTQVEDAARFRVVTGEAAKAGIDVVQVNAFGFSGQNSSLVLTRE